MYGVINMNEQALHFWKLLKNEEIEELATPLTPCQVLEIGV